MTKTPYECFNQAYLNKKLASKEDECIISTNAEYSFLYAKFILRSRFLAAEEIISRNANWACVYAHEIIQGKWDQAEKVIANSESASYFYAIEVLKGRFELGEASILNDCSLHYAHAYAEGVIKHRWIELEVKMLASGIFDDSVIHYTINVVKHRLPIMEKNCTEFQMNRHWQLFKAFSFKILRFNHD